MRIAFFRSDYQKNVSASYCLGALTNRPDTEVWQFCPHDFPESLPTGDPLDSLNSRHNLIQSPTEFRRLLRAGQFDLVILIPGTNWRTDPFSKFAHWALEQPLNYSPPLARQRWRLRLIPEPLFAHVPTIVLDLGDSAALSQREIPLLIGDRPYFKREIPFDRNRLFPGTGVQPPWMHARIAENLRYLPLGINSARYEQLTELRTAEKDFDIFWAGATKNNTQRGAAVARLNALAATRDWKVITPGKPLPFAEFGQLMARSKITLSVAGNGWDCYRHYEALGAGSLPLMNRPTVDAPAWHELPEPLFFENHFGNFEDRISDLLTMSEAERAELHGIADQRVRQRCLWSQSINYVLAETRKRFPDLPA